MQRHRAVAFDVNLGRWAESAVRSLPVLPDEEEEAPAVLRALDVAPPGARIRTRVVLRLPVEELGANIARRETERDALRASGRQEKYLAAFCDLESLELRLEQLRQEGLRTSMKNDQDYPRAPLFAPGVNRAAIAGRDGDSGSP